MNLSQTIESRNCIHAFWEFFNANDLIPIEIEYTVYGDGWAGTMDLKCILNKKKTTLSIMGNTKQTTLNKMSFSAMENVANRYLRLSKKLISPNGCY